MEPELDRRPPEKEGNPDSGAASSSEARPRSGSRSALRREVRGLGYEEGASRLRPRGSATVVASAGPREWAFDNSFAPALQEILAQHPGQDLADVLALVATRELAVGNPEQADHHATIAQVGAGQAAPKAYRAGRKRAVLVANQNYVGISPLETPADEAMRFQEQLRSRGFQVQTAADATAEQMREEYEGLVEGAGPEDELVGYFSGHGSPAGLIGVLYGELPGDILPNAAVSDVVDQGVQRGAQMSFILDSCHSGAAVRTVMSEQIARSRRGPTAASRGARSPRAIALAEATRKDLRRFSAVWERVVGPVLQSILSLKGKDLNGYPDSLLLARDAELDRLRAVRARLEHRLAPMVARIWNRRLEALKLAAREVASRSGRSLRDPPEAIADVRTLGDQLDWLDDLQNQALNLPPRSEESP
jgi:hypothetical protein